MTFRLKSVNFESKDLRLVAQSSDKHSNHFTVIIGKNGIGKSRLLTSIANTFLALDRWRNNLSKPRIKRDRNKHKNSEIFSLKYEIDKAEMELFYQYNGVGSDNFMGGFLAPRKVLCTSVSPFDKFPVEKKLSLDKDDREISEKHKIYRYIGSKNETGQFSSSGQINRVMESLIFATNKSQRELHQLANVFFFLGYLPVIRAVYGFNQNKETIERLIHQEIPEDALFDSYINRSKINSSRVSPRRLELEWHEFKELNMVGRLSDAARNIVNKSGNNDYKQLSFDLDFRRYGDQSWVVDLYEDIALLRKFRFLHLTDLLLVKEPFNNWIPIKEASSGEQCIVLTLLGIGSEITENSLICIDEPEISLHPEWQERYIDLLTKTFSDVSGCHFILATHSPLILSRIRAAESSVLLLDEGKVYSGKDYSKKSSDYQLVEAFKTPGYKNEYLTREALTIISQLSTTGKMSTEYNDKLKTLREASELLEKDDPVKKLIESIFKALEVLKID